MATEAERREIEIGKPVDFSFKKIKKLEAMGVEGARQSRTGKVPERSATTRKYLTKAIWLNNNKLTSIENMDKLVEAILEQPEKLGWIDFSFNYITHIDESILKFPDLKIIYFHGNNITDLDEVFKLRPLKQLKSVTFHGNPIAEHPNYRSYIIAVLPQIKNIDFTPVLGDEKLHPFPPEAVKRLQTPGEAPPKKKKGSD